MRPGSTCFAVLAAGVQGENGIIFGLDMSGEMHMRRRNEVFGCIPHGRGALSIRHLPDGAAGLLECDSFN